VVRRTGRAVPGGRAEAVGAWHGHPVSEESARYPTHRRAPRRRYAPHRRRV